MSRLAFPPSTASPGAKRVFVTVGMGRWPFDRLVAALGPLCQEHDVVAQIGTSTVTPPCPHERFIDPSDFVRLVDEADVVVTHAGNTVRVVQRSGKTPVAVPRVSALGEMGNDHQVDYLADEGRAGRVVAVWDVAALPDAVRAPVPALPAAGLEPAPPPPAIRSTMRDVEAEVFDDPFAAEPPRRYSYAWRALRSVTGPHLDVGCGDGAFLAAFGAATGRPVVGVDAHRGYLERARRAHPGIALAHVSRHGSLPFRDDAFASVTLLDVLEHCADELTLLREARRVIRPGGVLVVTLPARFGLGWLDPDDVKYRMPRVHRLLYSARFGRAIYHQRFEDLGDGLVGDCAVERTCHQHYDEHEIGALLEKAGFSVVASQRSGLLGNVLSVGASVLGSRLGSPLRRLVLLDSDVFAAANLFVTARRDR